MSNLMLLCHLLGVTIRFRDKIKTKVISRTAAAFMRHTCEVNVNANSTTDHTPARNGVDTFHPAVARHSRVFNAASRRVGGLRLCAAFLARGPQPSTVAVGVSGTRQADAVA